MGLKKLLLITLCSYSALSFSEDDNYHNKSTNCIKLAKVIPANIGPTMAELIYSKVCPGYKEFQCENAEYNNYLNILSGIAAFKIKEANETLQTRYPQNYRDYVEYYLREHLIPFTSFHTDTETTKVHNSEIAALVIESNPNSNAITVNQAATTALMTLAILVPDEVIISDFASQIIAPLNEVLEYNILRNSLVLKTTEQAAHFEIVRLTSTEISTVGTELSVMINGETYGLKLYSGYLNGNVATGIQNRFLLTAKNSAANEAFTHEAKVILNFLKEVSETSVSGKLTTKAFWELFTTRFTVNNVFSLERFMAGVTAKDYWVGGLLRRMNLPATGAKMLASFTFGLAISAGTENIGWKNDSDWATASVFELWHQNNFHFFRFNKYQKCDFFESNNADKIWGLLFKGGYFTLPAERVIDVISAEKFLNLEVPKTK